MRPAVLASLALVALGAPAVRAQDGPPPRLDFPLACRIGQDCEVQHYVDRDPGPGARDYNCGRRTYDKHDGIDIRLLDMAGQRRGVEVLAAAAGRVVAVRDGVPDVSVRAPGAPSVAGHECGNRVAINHGGGWGTDYCHLARGSLKVKPGDTVAAGQPIGRVGLSGDTEFPHLHMSLRHGAQVVDPFAPDLAAGGCGARASLWSPAAQQALSYKRGAILNAGFAAEPVTMGRIEDGAIAPPGGDPPVLVAYVRAIGLDAGDAIEMSIRGPDGRVLVQPPATTLADYKDQQFMYAGRKRPATGWPHGRYTAEVRIIRNGLPPLERRFSATL